MVTNGGAGLASTAAIEKATSHRINQPLAHTNHGVVAINLRAFLFSNDSSNLLNSSDATCLYSQGVSSTEKTELP